MKQKIKTLSANDKRSIVKNPNSEEYLLDIANRIKLGHIKPEEVKIEISKKKS
ncbi:MAG: hypothetical protein KF744_07025 [Taibaiella sp.]|nr:hypothetical protein [Taibaiella sp.]